MKIPDLASRRGGGGPGWGGGGGKGVGGFLSLRIENSLQVFEFL